MAHISINPDNLLQLFSQHDLTGITVYAIEKNQAFVRTFFSANGIIIEDPACGSGNAAVAAYIKATNLVASIAANYQAHQGQFIGRKGKISVRIEDKISIGGHCLTVFDGLAF